MVAKVFFANSDGIIHPSINTHNSVVAIRSIDFQIIRKEPFEIVSLKKLIPDR